MCLIAVLSISLEKVLNNKMGNGLKYLTSRVISTQKEKMRYRNTRQTPKTTTKHGDNHEDSIAAAVRNYDQEN